MSKPPDRVPDWWVERLATGELDRRTAARIQARLAESNALDRLDQIADSNRALLAAHPPAAVAEEVERRLAQRTGQEAPRRILSAGWLVPGLAVGASALIGLWLVVLTPEPPASQVSPATSGETVVSKGLAPHLAIYKKVATGATRLAASSRVRAGDVLQVAYVSAGRRYGVIASVDGLGAVTLHLPETPGRAAGLVPSREVPVPHAFELDASPGFERFVFATSDAPFTTALVVEALSSGDLARLPESVAVTDIRLEKENTW